MLDAEFVICPKNPHRAKKILKALAVYCGINTIDSPTYKKDWLFMWGPGGSIQRQIAKKQHEAGGQVVFFDIGYFSRDQKNIDGGVRLTFNEPHPQRYLHLAPSNSSRFNKYAIKMEYLYKEDGPIVLCGLGRKSRALYGYSGLNWERSQLAKIRAYFPDKEVIYRPKPNHPETLSGTKNGINGSIRQHVNGASLVVCHHSNVAVDCAVFGVPCICFDGIGVNLWPNIYEGTHLVPAMEERLNFLYRVAYFNWSIRESRDLLEFIKNNASAIRSIAKPSSVRRG